MADTALSALQPEQKKAWLKESMKAYRENSFFEKFMGSDSNSIVERITELKLAPGGGTRAGISLTAELTGTGVAQDGNLEGNEEALDSTWVEIKVDHLSHAVRETGRLETQKSVINARLEAKDKLAFWRAKIFDELCVLTLSGVAYTQNTDGSVRAGGATLTSLAFAADLTAPSSARHFNYDGTNLTAGDTAVITSASVPKYGMIVDLAAKARTSGLKPIRAGGREFYVLLVHPVTFAYLKKDADFRSALLDGMPRDAKHPIFTGAHGVTMDGIVIHFSNRVYNTLGAAPGSKWGAAGAINGTRSLLMGAQALACADLYGAAEWDEEWFNYKRKMGISMGMMFGLLKPRFKSQFNANTVQDFGVMCVNTYAGI